MTHARNAPLPTALTGPRDGHLPLCAVTCPNIAFIGCWYRYDLYSHNCCHFVQALRRRGFGVDVITSNCSCFSSVHRFAVTRNELINSDCIALHVPYTGPDPARRPGILKYLAINVCRLHIPLEVFRGIFFYRRARHAATIHYDQVLRAFGFLSLLVLILLSRLFRKNMIATVHEIDPFQRTHKWLNRCYNYCARVLVYSRDMAVELMRLGVRPETIEIIRYGVEIPQLTSMDKTQFIYFGGHNILRGKGFQELLDALGILKKQGENIRVLIYVGKGCNGLSAAKEMARLAGVSDMISWSEFISGDDLVAAYQASKACLVPFTGGSARHPVSCAMANGIPVIATRAVDIPEYLGDLGYYVEGDGNSIAAAITAIERDPAAAASMGRDLRAKAIAELNFDGIAERVGALYSQLQA